MTTPITVVVSEADVAALRDLLQVTVEEYPDSELAELLALTVDDAGAFSQDAAAAEGWRRQAAKFSRLVNTSESGSTRALGDLYKNALQMADLYEKRYEKEGGNVVASSARPRTRRIVRPS